MRKMDEQWVGRFRSDWSDDELDQILRNQPPSIKLGSLTVEEARSRFRGAAYQVFVPDEQRRKLVRKVLDWVRVRAAELYSSEKRYLERLMLKGNPWPKELVPPLCMLGLAGVGKSELLKAIGRLLVASPLVSVPGVRNITLTSHWPLTMKDGASLSAVLEPFLRDPSIDRNYRSSTFPKASERASRITWRDGVCLLTADEFQFVTSSSTANARVSSLLLSLLDLGPNLLFACNYSLVHRLMARHPEDRQRLLVNQAWLLTDDATSIEWRSFVSALCDVDPEAFGSLQGDGVLQLHEYTWGLRRATVNLLVAAYTNAREKRRKKLSIDDLVAGFSSPEYAVHRQEVDTLSAQCIRNEMINPALWCPISGRSGIWHYQPNGPDAEKKVVDFPTIKEDIERRTNNRLVQAALTPAEKAGIEAFEVEPKAKRAQILRPRFKGKATVDELLGK